MKSTIRSLRQRPAFSATVIATLALSLGLATAILSLVHEVFVKPLPYPEADRLGILTSTLVSQNWTDSSASVSELRDVGTRASTLETVAIYAAFRTMSLTGNGPAERVDTTFCDAEYFTLHGASPLFGRLFTPAEAQRGVEAPYVVLRHRFWQNRLGGRVDVIGSTLRLNDRPYTVIGVLPPDFRAVGERRHNAEIFLPMQYAPLLYGDQMFDSRTAREFYALAKLKPGVSLAAAHENLAAIAADLGREFPVQHQGWGFNLIPVRDFFFSEVSRLTLALGGGAVFVLLIACVNLGHLFLVQGEARRREFTVRAALGASRRQLLRQCFAEIAALTSLGGLAGLALGSGFVELFNREGALQVPTFTVFAVNPTVVLAVLGLLVACSVGFGLWPALRASRVDLRTALGATDRSAGDKASARRRFLFISAEVALAVLLLVGAGLTVRTLFAINATHPGFAPERLLTATIELDRTRYGDLDVAARATRQLHEQLQGLPGADSTVIWGPRVIGRATFNVINTPEGLDPAVQANRYMARWHSVSPDALIALRIPLVAGRHFDPALGRDSPPEVIVGQNYARRFFPAGDAVGRTLTFSRAGRSYVARIIGVAGDVRHLGRAFDESGIIGDLYFSNWQNPAPAFVVMVRYQADPAPVLAALKDRVAKFDPSIALADVATMEARMARQEGMQALTASIFSAYAALATFLAALGVYGVLAFTVSQRTREFGVRLAVGATPQQILGPLLRTSMGWIGLGIAAGLVAAYFLSSLIKALLVGVATNDPLVYGGTAVGVIVIGLAACLVPAWRASRTDPLVALRAE